jgi:hypothetical protein
MADTTVGLGGYGLLISPACPCRAHVTDDGELVISHADREVARFSPSDEPATGAPTWRSPSEAQFGEDGPVLTLASGVNYDDVFVRIDTELGESPWCGMSPGFILDLPLGVALVSPNLGEAQRGFELHPPTGPLDFIRFAVQPTAIGELEVELSANQTVVADEVIDVDEGDGVVRELRYVDATYQHEGEAWRQRYVMAPFGEAETFLVIAQARDAQADELFEVAMAAAITASPLR